MLRQSAALVVLALADVCCVAAAAAVLLGVRSALVYPALVAAPTPSLRSRVRPVGVYHFKR